MKLLIFLLTFTVSGFLQAQDSTVVQNYSATLQVGELLEFGDRSVKFKRLISDSRCPSDVTCIWAGEAKILVEVFKNGKSYGEEIVVISGGEQGEVSLDELFQGGSYRLSGIALRPYPKTTVRIKPSDYVLKLAVTETLQD